MVSLGLCRDWSSVARHRLRHLREAARVPVMVGTAGAPIPLRHSFKARIMERTPWRSCALRGPPPSSPSWRASPLFHSPCRDGGLHIEAQRPPCQTTAREARSTTSMSQQHCPRRRQAPNPTRVGVRLHGVRSFPIPNQARDLPHGDLCVAGARIPCAHHCRGMFCAVRALAHLSSLERGAHPTLASPRGSDTGISMNNCGLAQRVKFAHFSPPCLAARSLLSL